MAIRSFIKKVLVKLGLLKLLFPSKVTKHLSEVDAIYEFLTRFPKHKVMIDVGAHVGESFRVYEQIGWQVYAFEPDPTNREKIGKVQSNTRLFDFAISDKEDEEVTLYKSPLSSGITSLTPFHETHEPVAKVKTKTLDRVCREENITGADFLKIDAEGFDLHVLKGFPFDRFQPRVILTEFEDKKTLDLGYTYKDLGNILRDNGYVVFLSEWKPILRYGIQHRWDRLMKFTGNEQLNHVDAWGNFIAVRPEDVENFEPILSAAVRKA